MFGLLCRLMGRKGIKRLARGQFARHHFYGRRGRTIRSFRVILRVKTCGPPNFSVLHDQAYMVIFHGTLMVELTFGRCKNSKTVMSFLFRFPSLKKHLGSIIRHGLTKKFETILSGYLTRNVALKIFCFSLSTFTPEKAHVNPKKHGF